MIGERCALPYRGMVEGIRSLNMDWACSNRVGAFLYITYPPSSQLGEGKILEYFPEFLGFRTKNVFLVRCWKKPEILAKSSATSGHFIRFQKLKNALLRAFFLF